MFGFNGKRQVNLTCLFHGTQPILTEKPQAIDCLRSAVKKTPLARCLFYGAPKRIRSERSERNSDCCALRQSRQRKVLSPPVRYDKTAILIAVFEWYTQADLNRQPSESESDALSSCAMGAYCDFALYA